MKSLGLASNMITSSMNEHSPRIPTFQRRHPGPGAARKRSIHLATFSLILSMSNATLQAQLTTLSVIGLPEVRLCRLHASQPLHGVAQLLQLKLAVIGGPGG